MNINQTEKITVNANVADLGKIDLLINEGYYANRTEFIKTAIKLQLDRHDEDVKQLLQAGNKKDWFIGVAVLTVYELETMKLRGQTKEIQGMGLLVIDKDVTLELMKDTISAIKINGVCRCSADIKEYYKL